jgi:intraflagellar transport protein 81
LASSSPESFFAKMEEDSKMNRFLSEETLPKKHEILQLLIRDFSSIISEPVSEKELRKVESEILQINEKTAQLAERKHKMSSGGDANLHLFRQQASIISNKKTGTLLNLNAVLKEASELRAEKESKESELKSNEKAKFMVGDEFKRYVSELRGKSTTYKRKKGELSSLMVEHGVLSRTQDILQNLENELNDKIRKFEISKVNKV